MTFYYAKRECSITTFNADGSLRPCVQELVVIGYKSKEHKEESMTEYDTLTSNLIILIK